jgi:Tol biopolymer transport system component
MWSVDGQWIYFASAEDGDWDIYRIRPNGGDLKNLTNAWESNEIMPALQWGD